jgi:serine/threonine protein kinase
MPPMDPERWRRVNELFHAALERAPGERDVFLDAACEHDPALRREVATLLAHADDAFLEVPAAALDSELTEPDDDPLIGRRLGPYEIREILGRGGMSVVYLAEDTRLRRPVAVKALAPRFTDQPALRERLRREARAVAALAHPGIAAVYALEDLDGQLVIVGEYVPGETLRSELARGPLAVPTLVETALAIGSALAAAHEQGVMHRDLKPENVIRSRTGIVKILDFGLARTVEAAAGVDPLVTRLTRSGVLVGTPAYMSPEQLRGDPVDLRSDLFSFGVLLYEVATAIHPFEGHDPVSTIARILDSTPTPLEELRPIVPPRLGRIVERLLQKRPEDRYDTTRALVAELDALRRDLEQRVAPSTAGPPGDVAQEGGRSPRWWWQFHQAATAAAICGLLVPLWYARGWLPGLTSPAIFFPALAAALVAAPLRLHLWFTAGQYPGELARQRQHLGPWIRWAETAFSAALTAAAVVLIGRDHVATAALFFGAAIALLVATLGIEPATTRAAFGDDLFQPPGT